MGERGLLLRPRIHLGRIFRLAGVVSVLFLCDGAGAAAHGLDTILVFAAVHAIILYTMFLLERKYRDGSKLIKITARELFTAAVLAIAVFSVSNISFAFTGTPFSSQFTAEIYIIRTTVDLGGVAMLFAYHVVILEISTEREMEHLQALLHMQYESYRISEESIALVNQKYHDLKHHIQLLRAASAAERTEYLDQMEQQIRTYEAQNKSLSS